MNKPETSLCPASLTIIYPWPMSHVRAAPGAGICPETLRCHRFRVELGTVVLLHLRAGLCHLGLLTWFHSKPHSIKAGLGVQKRGKLYPGWGLRAPDTDPTLTFHGPLVTPWPPIFKDTQKLPSPPTKKGKSSYILLHSHGWLQGRVTCSPNSFLSLNQPCFPVSGQENYGLHLM